MYLVLSSSLYDDGYLFSRIGCFRETNCGVGVGVFFCLITFCVIIHETENSFAYVCVFCSSCFLFFCSLPVGMNEWVI